MRKKSMNIRFGAISNNIKRLKKKRRSLIKLKIKKTKIIHKNKNLILSIQSDLGYITSSGPALQCDINEDVI